jgi:uncharacterized protein (TIGR00730 family)
MNLNNEQSPKSLCVFCGAQNAVPEKHLDMGEVFGKAMVEKSYTLVYGAGDCGVMGKVANSVLGNGGSVVGVFPVGLREIESEHQSLSEIILVNTMHERKQVMFDRSDAIIVLPGGFGTMDEFFEVLTWKQIRFHNKPIVVFNHEGYWDPLLKLMDNIVDTGFAAKVSATLYKVVDNIEDVFTAIHD